MKRDNNKDNNNFLTIILMFVFASILVCLPVYFIISGESSPNEASNIIINTLSKLDIFLIPLIFAVFIVLGLITAFLSKPKKTVETYEKKKDVNISGKKEQEHKDRRMYLNLLSLLQKEGRLLDFFSEDLSQFEDGQIGAAVRGVHENCSKIVKKYIDAEHVISENEGEEIIIEEDFDPDTIKLIGNVTGKPPFKGTIVHRGWQAKKIDIPSLSDSVNSKLIVPAEVEIK